VSKLPAQIAGYVFKDKALLKEALTHRSVAGNPSYERLEFLGDRVLNLCVAAWLYENEPDASEGQLAKRHAALVQEPTLAEIAQEWKIAPYIYFGPGEAHTGGREKPSILADVVEALLGAVFLEAGLQPVQDIVVAYWSPRAADVPLIDAKSQLQEFLQGQGLDLPDYEVVESHGKDHEKLFVICVHCALGQATGQGGSKQAASQAAAANLLEELIPS
jgi:ribonuclease-3